MRLVLIVLLLAACAPIVAGPIGAGQTPEAAAENLSPTPLGAAASVISAIPVVQPSSPPGIPSNRQSTIAPLRPTSALKLQATRPPAVQPVKPSTSPLLNQISAPRLSADLLALQAYHSRHSASAGGLSAGEIGSARAWLIDQLRGISPRLQVETDSFVFPFGNRPTAAQNIIATLPGRVNPPQIIIVSAHYDSRSVDIADVRSAAPGANDDGSGVAAVLELARALSPQGLDATYMFILFAGEEEGLFGSLHLAGIVRKDGLRIIAMLNNDIIGNVTGPDGQRVDNRVRIFSGDPDGGPSRQLAAEAKAIVERALPGFGVELVAALDRAGRGGDQIAFHYAGYPAIRFIEAVENLEHQHSPNDRVEFMDMAYLANVVRANLAVALQLGKTIDG